MSRTESITLYIDGAGVQVAKGCTIAAAIALHSQMGITRQSVSGELRAPFCGMGVCHECRVTVNGQRRLACQTLCVPDMLIETITEHQS